MKNHLGEYVVTAYGKILAFGKTHEELEAIAVDAQQRLIFKIEPEKKVDGIIRWPIRIT